MAPTLKTVLANVNDRSNIETLLVGQHQHGPYRTSLSSDKSILYALGIGASTKNLSYTYENHPGFQAFPTNYLTLRHQMNLTSFPGLPEFHPMSLVHGEESIKIHR